MELTHAAKEQILQQSRKARPYEACGVLLGSRPAGIPRVSQATAARNLLAGSSLDRFEMHPEDLLAAELQAAAQGLEVLGIWHSHPAGSAQASELDRQAAYPNWFYLILGLANADDPELRAWRLSDGHLRKEDLSEVHDEAG